MLVETLLARLEKVKRTGPGRWLARCPAHADRSPSLSVRETDQEHILIHCFGGCETRAVLAAVGLEFSDLFPERAADFIARPERRPFPAADVLRALSHEITVVAVAGDFILEGRAFTEADHARLRLAVQRIHAGIDLAGAGRC